MKQVYGDCLCQTKVVFFLSLHSRDLFTKGPCFSQMQKCQVLEVFYPFSKFLRFCKSEHNFFFRQGHEANIKVMDI